MAFAKMDIKSTVENERKDMEFEREYRRIKKEYALVEQLVKARKEKNITQRELAEVTGISQQAISRIEKEKHIPKMDTFSKVLDGLGLELAIVKTQNPVVKEELKTEAGMQC